MKKARRDLIAKTVVIYSILLLFVYLAGYSYWHKKAHEYWHCKAIDDSFPAGCGIEPNGPMGAVLFVLIPLGITLLFIIGLLLFRKKKGQSWGQL